MLSEIRRRLQLLGRRQTDNLRWAQPDSLKPSWDKRSPFAAALCADSHCVCDIGCGNQVLRSLLGHAVRYLPADLVKRTEDTAFCDLNNRVLPEEYLRNADTVTLLGVIEYIYDVPWVIKSLRKFVGTLIVSYNPVDMIDIDRREKGWVNDFRLDELARIIVASGYVLRDVNMVDAGQVVIRAAVDHILEKQPPTA